MRFQIIVGWRERKTNKKQLRWCLLSTFYLNMFRAAYLHPASQLHTTTASTTSQQCRTPHAVVHGLVLLMMSIMIPETCWDRSWIINIRLVASCWVFSLFTLRSWCTVTRAPNFQIIGDVSKNIQRTSQFFFKNSFDIFTLRFCSAFYPQDLNICLFLSAFTSGRTTWTYA